jgi:hypothetical protein
MQTNRSGYIILLKRIYFQIVILCFTVPETVITRSGVIESDDEPLKQGKHIPMFVTTIYFTGLSQNVNRTVHYSYTTQNTQPYSQLRQVRQVLRFSY